MCTPLPQPAPQQQTRQRQPNYQPGPEHNLLESSPSAAPITRRQKQKAIETASQNPRKKPTTEVAEGSGLATESGERDVSPEHAAIVYHRITRLHNSTKKAAEEPPSNIFVEVLETTTTSKDASPIVAEEPHPDQVGLTTSIQKTLAKRKPATKSKKPPLQTVEEADHIPNNVTTSKPSTAAFTKSKRTTAAVTKSKQKQPGRVATKKAIVIEVAVSADGVETATQVNLTASESHMVDGVDMILGPSDEPAMQWQSTVVEGSSTHLLDTAAEPVLKP